MRELAERRTGIIKPRAMTEHSDLPFASVSASDSSGALDQGFSLRRKGGGGKNGAASYPATSTAAARSALRGGWGQEDGSAVVQVH